MLKDEKKLLDEIFDKIKISSNNSQLIVDYKNLLDAISIRLRIEEALNYTANSI